MTSEEDVGSAGRSEGGETPEEEEGTVARETTGDVDDPEAWDVVVETILDELEGVDFVADEEFRSSRFFNLMTGSSSLSSLLSLTTNHL
jgi:hypothetical protein